MVEANISQWMSTVTGLPCSSACVVPHDDAAQLLTIRHLQRWRDLSSVLCAVSKRGVATGQAAGMADVFAWLQKDSMSVDTKPHLF